MSVYYDNTLYLIGKDLAHTIGSLSGSWELVEHVIGAKSEFAILSGDGRYNYQHLPLVRDDIAVMLFSTHDVDPVNGYIAAAQYGVFADYTYTDEDWEREQAAMVEGGVK